MLPKHILKTVLLRQFSDNTRQSILLYTPETKTFSAKNIGGIIERK